MTILAFDQATKCSGWSVYRDKELIAHGTFTFTDSNLGLRLWKIRQKVEELYRKYLPDKIVYEDIQLQQDAINNVATFKALAEVFGIIYEYATELGLPNEAILAGTWRKGLGIAGVKREERKANTQKWVRDNCGISISEDEADAIAIGAYAAGIRSKKQIIKQDLGFDWS